MNEIFKYRAPTSRAELFGLLADHGEGAKVLAGGTDLLVDIRERPMPARDGHQPEEGRRLLRPFLERVRRAGHRAGT